MSNKCKHYELELTNGNGVSVNRSELRHQLGISAAHDEWLISRNIYKNCFQHKLRCDRWLSTLLALICDICVHESYD